MTKPKDAPSAPPAEIIPPEKGAKASKTKAALTKLGLVDPHAAERDPELDGLMSEIEADLREEELRKLWQRYGKLIIAALVIAVIAVGGVQFWRNDQTKRRLALATHYEQAMHQMRDGKTDDALAALADVAGHSGEGYAAVAQLQRAATLLTRGDTDGAVAIYKALAADSNADQAFRDLATVLQVLHSIDREAPKPLEALLSPLLLPGNAFNPTALELSALLAAKQGEFARAGKLLDQILEDPNAPPSLRTRATDLAAYYKAMTPSESVPTPSHPVSAKP